MGEIALMRGASDVALEQYQRASVRMNDPEISRRATLIALGADDEAAARLAADRWEERAPADIEMAQYQAVLHARAGETGAALDYLLKMVDSDGEAGANLQMITSLLAGEPNRWRAADLMARLAAARPEYAEGWYGAALLALEAERPALAVAFSTRALERAPDLLDTKFLKARSQLALRPGGTDSENVLKPLSGFRRAADPGQRYRYAGLLVLAGRDAEADALYEDILVNDPDQHDARMARALLALGAERLDVAEAELHVLLERHGRVQDAMYYLGTVAERRNAPTDAVEWYSRISPDVPRWLDAQAAIGRLLLEHEGPDAMAEFFAELRRLWPQHVLALTLHEANLLTVSGYPERALSLLNDYETQGTGERAALRWQMALATAEAGKSAKAESLLRELLDADPDNPSLQNALGYLLLEQGDRLEEAERLLESAFAAAPANPVVLDSLGWLRFRQERFPEARHLLEESWWREPSAITGMHLLTMLLTLDSVAAADFRVELRKRFPQLMDTEGSR